MWRMLPAGAIVLFSFTVAASAEFTAIITRVDGDRITLTKGKGGDLVVLPAGDKLLVAKGKLNKDTKKMEVGEVIPEGLKSQVFATGKVSCRIVTDDNGSITHIFITTKKKKGV